MIAYGGKDFITPDGKLHTDDPKVREAAVRGIVKLTTPYKEGYVPPGVVSWNDADDNNAFHSKLMVMDFDGSISTELALYNNKQEYDATVTHGLPLGNGGDNLHAQVVGFGPTIPKGAKNVAAAKEFITYMLEPKVLNQYLKGGLGRFAIPVPEIAKSDPFWLAEDPHRTVHTRQTLFGPTLPIYEAYNPAIAQVDAEHVFSIAEFDVMKNGMAPEAAIDKAFKRAEEIFAKYPITQA
jgi:multiple sugar transport system substrate-binding protein